MKKFSKRKAAAGILCLGLVMQSAAYLPATAETTSKVTVNEVCSKNTIYKAADGSCYDWIELYNSDSSEADISGWGLSDKEDQPYRFTFPDGTCIPAKGRLTVFCDSNAAASNNSIVPFGLSSTGETLTLTDKQGNTAQTLTFGALASDTSYGQYPDGSGEFYELSCTPDKANSAPEGSAAVHLPAFSKDSGFYDSSFQLTLTADEGCTIYYTIDGSEPTSESEKYTAPITVKDMSDTQNRLSARTDIAPNGVEVPREKVDKAAVIRAVAVDSEGRVSQSVTKTYFIGKTNSGYYPNMKVVSLVTDPDNLFDYETGIYCLGKAYETENKGGRGVEPWNLIANYSKKGKEWERPASFTMFDNGEKVIDQNVGIRIKGGYSRSLPQKSFTIYTRKDYGASEFDYDFFSGKATKAKNGKAIKKYEGVVLRNGGNDNSTAFFRDSINQSLITDRNIAYQATSECIVFLDGEFWGIYQVMEKLDKGYISEHFGVKKSDVAIIKNGELDEGTDQDLADWTELVKGVNEGRVSYDEFCRKVDVQSYIDYIAAQIYWTNADWPQRNLSVWRSDALDETNPYADGKWRPILFDTESGQGLYGSYDKSANADCYSRLRQLNDDFAKMFIKLLDNEDFAMQYARTFMDLANHNFTTDITKKTAQSYQNSFKQQILDTFARFHANSMGGSNAERQLENAYSTVINFYAQRYQYAERTTRSALKLTSEPHTLTVKNSSDKGSIKLNTLDLGNTDQWSGKYHSDYDLTLTAIPAEEGSFTRWSIRGAEIVEGDENSPVIKVKLSSDAVVRPLYGDEEEEEEVITTEPTTEAQHPTDPHGEKPGIRGDVNSDGKFNVADIVMLQRWLSGDKNTQLSDWKSGDLCEDGIIDLFDLVSMRREILRSMNTPEKRK